MKTQKNISNRKRRNTIFLLLSSFVLALFANMSYSQEISSHIKSTDDFFETANINEVDTNYTYKWNEDSNRWEMYNREIKFYKQNQNLLATLNQRYQTDKGTWTNYDRSLKSYSQQNNLIENLSQQWDDLSDRWVNLQLKTISYDKSGNKSEILYHQWRKAAGKWFSTVRYLMEYNDFGEKHKILIKKYNPSTDTWSNYSRYVFKYDDNMGPPDVALVEVWNSYDETWENRGKYTMDYDVRGNKTKERRATWNESLTQWINGMQLKRSYNKNLLMSEIEQRWDFRLQSWNNAIKYNFMYDEEGELSKMIEKRWKGDSAQWVEKNRFLYSEIKELPKAEEKRNESEKDK